MATDALSVVWGLAAAVKEAYDGVQGNKEQCKMLNDHVQNVAKALKGLPSATRQKKEVESAMRKLVETLRSATDLIEGFKTQNWIAKMFKQSSTKAKFDELFNELDKVLQVCGFALEVRKKRRSGWWAASFFSFSLSFRFKCAGGGEGLLLAIASVLPFTLDLSTRTVVAQSCNCEGERAMPLPPLTPPPLPLPLLKRSPTRSARKPRGRMTRRFSSCWKDNPQRLQN